MKTPLREGIVSQGDVSTTCSWSLRNPLSIDARLSKLQNASTTIHTVGSYLEPQSWGKIIWA